MLVKPGDTITVEDRAEQQPEAGPAEALQKNIVRRSPTSWNSPATGAARRPHDPPADPRATWTRAISDIREQLIIEIATR